MSNSRSDRQHSQPDDNGSNLRFVNAKIVTPEGVIENGVCEVIDGKIDWIGSVDDISDQKEIDVQSQHVIDAQGGWLLPGFVDIHVHGGMGEDFMDASKPDVLAKIAAFHGANGSTSMLATTMTASHAMIDDVLEAVWHYRKQGEKHGAHIEGVHLEGPFISPKWPGAQNPEHISPPRTDWLIDWEARFPGLIRQLTLAPEREGALDTIAWLRANGITAALGHTDASYEEVLAAIDAGLTHAVHTFNAMTPLHHRKPGTAGAVLGQGEIVAEVIADGIHVHPGAIQLLAKVKTDGNLVLVTDAMSAAGLGDGDYFLGDLPVVVKDGVALTQGGALAGSRLTMAEGFRFLVQEARLSVERASDAASGAPARQAGLYEFTGSIQPGKRADFVLMDAALELRGVWAEGVKIG
ncbi:N-acetylglucosamine-6-phosphate deacetylase [Saccharibacillus sp. JS10]|uniref:N-acetylglucosamine-6-phosphate deacetylase n=1 Tax=Saccharibacillus sp. JS10 TaxID=2950552 RepID=UPI00210A530F|nr:N-acetylglucosamine-6-phosphate deacetylase [Saccharibacillus sp. JS10]MCQ4088460.1 N-acetylglucosamine-6-phosphate deacetylase [Saccharibacillus sp. JS10]